MQFLKSIDIKKKLWRFTKFHLTLSATSFALLFICALFTPAFAQGISIDFGTGEGASATGRIIQLVALLTVLSLAPSILVMMTSFTRIIVVLSLMRTAIGVQQTPPNTVLISLALFMTFFIMAPTFQKSYEEGISPLINEEVEEIEGFELAAQPFKEFMLRQTREQDLTLFINMSQTGPYEEADEVPLHIVVPSFMISELRRAFEIGFMLFMPFLIIDLVIAAILMSMGMMMLPPTSVSLPFKIIFFVLVDGWHLIAGSLIQGFNL